MKSNKCSHLLILSVAALLSFFFVSCSKDEEEESDMQENTENLSNQDPEGTIVLNLISGADGNYYTIGDLGEIHVDAANNFRGKESDYKIEFVNIGRVDGLARITQIPVTGWSKSAAVVPGTGYVMRYTPWSGYGRPVEYARIYVVDYLTTATTDEFGTTTGSNSGAIIKYQAPFQLPIKLDKTSLSFSSERETMTLTLENPTSVTVEEKPDWCEVTTKDNTIAVTVSENLTAEQRQGEIILSNTSSTVKITVTQKGASSPMFQAGSGTKEDPYQIKNANQLKSITKALNAHFVLTADITLNEDANGSGWDPIGKKENPFTGTLDGQGHTIKNMWMKRPTTNGVGLFGYINNATISRVILETDDNGIKGAKSVGGICGYGQGNSSFNKCAVKGNIAGNEYIGSICGETNGSVTISECYSEGSITGTQSYDYVGGIVGVASPNLTTITECYSKASLKGGLCDGVSFGGTHSQCYYAGKVSNTNSNIMDGKFTCGGIYTYYDKTIIGATNLYDTQNARTTQQMMTQSNYEGWDFVKTWKITEGKTYPTLRWYKK
ncbi:hypothetical protein L6475_00265 [Prevotella sp. E9-3]|uniref:BACON domain-containing protein n=1 Tax=Prevotella sp. E9-3 TaxID=2913621 RepID=UPI001EDBBDEE|nr:BACON domain-containing carbohydrate-binding protein [Prevotella sp. E9-3]UKK48436.1 hypothetical protein L6475_00265 [Prevotella sp. E9-3]